MISESRIGVFFCRRASGPAGQADLAELTRYASHFPAVTEVRDLGELPRLDPEALTKEFNKLRLTTVVIAGDSPGFFKPAFARALAEAGGDPERVRLASFREHGALYGNVTERAKAVLCCAIYGVPTASPPYRTPRRCIPTR
jgi:heterodisulfide reductase subunit A-like polyferredoxin